MQQNFQKLTYKAPTKQIGKIVNENLIWSLLLSKSCIKSCIKLLLTIQQAFFHAYVMEAKANAVYEYKKKFSVTTPSFTSERRNSFWKLFICMYDNLYFCSLSIYSLNFQVMKKAHYCYRKEKESFWYSKKNFK